MFRCRVLLAGAVSALVVVVTGTSGAMPTRTMSVRITFSGDYTGHVNWTHAQNGPGTQLVNYGCMQWTVAGKPRRYAVIFGQAYEQKQSLLLKFDYDPSGLGQPHRLRRPEFVGVVVTAPDGKQYDALDPGRAAVTITLARNLLGGSFDVKSLNAFPQTNRKLNIAGSWRCASLFRRSQ